MPAPRKAAADDTGIPSTIPIRPLPALTVVVYGVGRHESATAIGRRWHPGDAARCRRCDRCNVIPGDGFDGCLIVALGYVSEDDAPDYSTVGKARHHVGPIVIEGPPRSGSA